MRLGLIIYGPLDDRSGGFLYDEKLVDYLRRQGDDVAVISLPWSGYGRRLTHNFSPALIRRLRRARFDILLQDELNHPSLFLFNRLPITDYRTPKITIVHHLRSSESRPAWQNWFYRLVERAYLRGVDGFICNSQTTLAAVEKTIKPQRSQRAQRNIKNIASSASFAIKSFRPSVIAYPAGDRFQPDLSDDAIIARAHEPGPLRIIFVGNLIPRKGLPLLLDATAALPPEVCRLDVVGDTAVHPDHTRTIHRQIERLGLENRVRLHGRLPDNDLASLLAASHLLAVPSSYEGFGIVYLEGMGFGLPAIAGRGGAAHEIVTHGENGILCQLPIANCQLRIVNFLATLHQNRERLAQMSLAARRRYLAHPTWDESMARIHQFLHSLTIDH